MLRFTEASRSNANLLKVKHPLLYWRTGPLPSVKNDKNIFKKNRTDSSLIVQNRKCTIKNNVLQLFR